MTNRKWRPNEAEATNYQYGGMVVLVCDPTMIGGMVGRYHHYTLLFQLESERRKRLAVLSRLQLGRQ